jgi:hypothetical protein
MVGNGFVKGLAMRDDSVGIACSIGAGPPFFARTTDGGVTWQNLGRVKADGAYGAAFPAGSTQAWFAGERTVAFSSDNGETWVEQPTDYVFSQLNSISFSDPAHGWIVTWEGGILRYRMRETTTGVTVRLGETLPSRAILEQNYPNPFNPSTTINFELPKTSHVTLTVFDVLGRQVSVLVNERKEAGVHEVNFDASGLASGVYFYRLQAGDFVQSKKFLLLK